MNGDVKWTLRKDTHQKRGGVQHKNSRCEMALVWNCSMLIGIPTIIVLLSDVPFSSTFSHTIINTAIICVILGKMITVLEKKKKRHHFASDIGVMIGLALD